MALETWQYAALAELVYRRAAYDLPLKLSEIAPGWVGEVPANVALIPRFDTGLDGHLIDISNGLTALILRSGGEYIVVFRGTDTSSTSDGEDIVASILGSLSASPGNNDGLVDSGDWISNIALGVGSYDWLVPDGLNLSEWGEPFQTQWSGARAIIEELLGLVSGDTTKITVVGQSLGGGLAGLAAAAYDLNGYLFGPAPFENQLKVEARYKVIGSLADSIPSGPGAYGNLLTDYNSGFTAAFKSLDSRTQTNFLFGYTPEQLISSLQNAIEGIVNDDVLNLPPDEQDLAAAGAIVLNDVLDLLDLGVDWTDSLLRGAVFWAMGWVDTPQPFATSSLIGLSPMNITALIQELVDLGLAIEQLNEFIEDASSVAEAQFNLFSAHLHSGSVYTSTVSGEFTTSLDGFDAPIGNGVDLFTGNMVDSYDDVFLDRPFVNSGTLNSEAMREELGRHSPALHALLLRAKAEEEVSASEVKFAKALTENLQLYWQLFVDTEASAYGVSSKVPVVSGDPSATGVVGETSLEPLYRLLWQSFDHQEGAFYEYFTELFGEVLLQGAAAEGIDETPVQDGEITGNLSAGIHALILEKIRWRTSLKESYNEAVESLTGDEEDVEFAGAWDKGYLILEKEDSKPIPGVSLGNPIGVAQINAYVARQLQDESDPGFLEEVFGVAFSDVQNGTVQMPNWDVLIVQAGSDDGGLTVDLADTDLIDPTKTYLILGGTDATGGDIVYGSAESEGAMILTLAGDDLVFGSETDEIIIGGSGDDDLFGGGGNDVLAGGAGDDRIYSVGGSNLIHAGRGDDQIFISGEELMVDGGAGRDGVYVVSATSPFGENGQGPLLTSVEAVYGSEFDDTIWLSDTSFRNLIQKLSGSGGTTLVGSGGRDTLFGATANQTVHLWGGYGDPYDPADPFVQDDGEGDSLIGGVGKDIFYVVNGGFEGTWIGGSFVDFISLSEAIDARLYDYVDTLYNVQAGDEIVRVGDSNNGYSGGTEVEDWAGEYALIGEDGSTSWYAAENGLSGSYFIAVDNSPEGQGRVVLAQESGAAHFVFGNFQSGDFGISLSAASNAANVSPPTAGDDWRSGGSGDDNMSGGDGNDSISGGAGNDVLNGGAGDDYLRGGSGNDTVSGGEGDDTLIGGDGAGDDSYEGGDGFDTLIFTSTKLGVVVDLLGGTAIGSETGSDTILSVEAVIGGDGDDILTGDANDNVLIGGAGFDTLYGGDGDDVLADDAPGVSIESRPDLIKTSTAGNHDILTAMSVDGYFDLDESDFIESSADVPHATVQAVGSDEYDYYALTVQEAGQFLTVDIDDSVYLNGRNWALPRVTVLDSNGDIVAEWTQYEHYYEPENAQDGSYLEYEFEASGQYYVVINYANEWGWDDDPVFAGNSYTLHISLTDAPVMRASGNNILEGGGGNDTIYGGLDNDVISGGTGDDVIHASAGTDQVDGGDGWDIIEFKGPASSYDWEMVSGNLVVTDLTWPAGQTVLTNVEIMRFGDGDSYDILPGLAPNRAPAAGLVTVSTAASVPVTVLIADILGAAFDADGDTLVIEDVYGATGGSVTSDSSSITFMPETGFDDAFASFSYRLSDGEGGLSSGTVQVAVGDAVHSPVVRDVRLRFEPFEPAETRTFSVYELLETASHPEDAPLSIVEINGEELDLFEEVILASGAAILRVDETTYIYEARDAFDHLGEGAIAEDVFSFTVAGSDGGTSSGVATALTYVELGISGPETISFTTVSDDSQAVFADNVIDPSAEVLVPGGDDSDVRFVSVLGNGDQTLDAGELGYVMSQTDSSGRLTSLGADNNSADRVIITGHGRTVTEGQSDLTGEVRYSGFAGFGLANAYDSGLAENELNDGDSLHFEVFAGDKDVELDIFSFIVSTSGGSGSVTVLLDVDGNVMEGTPGALTEDALAQITDLSDGDYVEIDFWYEEILINGNPATEDYSLFFDTFRGEGGKALTLGATLGSAPGWSVQDAVLEIYSYPNGFLQPAQSMISQQQFFVNEGPVEMSSALQTEADFPALEATISEFVAPQRIESAPASSSRDYVWHLHEEALRPIPGGEETTASLAETGLTEFSRELLRDLKLHSWSTSGPAFMDVRIYGESAGKANPYWIDDLNPLGTEWLYVHQQQDWEAMIEA